MQRPTTHPRAPRRSARLLAVAWALFWVVAAFQPCVMAAGLAHGPAGGDSEVAAPVGDPAAAEAPCLHCELPDFQPAAPVEPPQAAPASAAAAPLAAIAAPGPVLRLSGADSPPQRTPTYLYLRVLRL